jgi:S-adenosylmethionine decarboxylase
VCSYLCPPQAFPHSSFEQELGYLKAHSSLSEKLNGSGYVLGPMTGDHWFVYVADMCSRPSYECHDRVLNVMMFDLAPEVRGMKMRMMIMLGMMWW